MHQGRGTSAIRRAALAGVIGLLFAGTEVLAARNCVSNTGNGRSPRVRGLKAVGLTSDGRLVCFSTGAPERADDVGFVTGLGGADTSLVGIDFRVQDGQLYGVGNGGGVYRIDPTTAQATFVNQLSVPLDPTAAKFGVDFNPAADRLRIISDMGQNLRHNVNMGGTTISDSPPLLNYTAGVTPGPTATGLTGAAYTNNDLPAPATTSPTGTTLYDLDTNLNQIAVQSPPNAGSLVATGALGVDPSLDAGFDIYSVTLKTGDGGLVAVNNFGYAALTVGGSSGFYAVNVPTGAVFLLGTFDDVVVDVALPVNQN
jgi:hypothetical protein